jgi:hypothetical protein
MIQFLIFKQIQYKQGALFGALAIGNSMKTEN